MRLSVVRLPVVLLGVVAVLGVAGILVWGGGDEPEYATTTADGGSGSASSPGFASPDAATDSGSGGTTVAPPPFNPADVAPSGGQPITPTETRAILAWRVPYQDWSSVVSLYRSYLGATGYRLGIQRITTTDGDTGAPLGGAWDIEPDQAGGQVAIGLLYIGPDPADPESTIVEVEVD